MRIITTIPDNASMDETDLFMLCARKAVRRALAKGIDSSGWMALSYDIKKDQFEGRVYANVQSIKTGLRVLVGWEEGSLPSDETP